MQVWMGMSRSPFKPDDLFKAINEILATESKIEMVSAASSLVAK